MDARQPTSLCGCMHVCDPVNWCACVFHPAMYELVYLHFFIPLISMYLCVAHSVSVIMPFEH